MCKNIICFFPFSFITRNIWNGQVRERVKDCCTHRVRYESSENHFFVWFLWDWYKATSRHQIVLVSTHFSTFMSFIQLRLFSTSQTWAIWCKASTQSGITSSSSSACLFHSPWFEIFPSLYNFPAANTILVVTPPTYKLQEDVSPIEHATYANSAALPLRKYLYSVYFRKQEHILL